MPDAGTDSDPKQLLVGRPSSTHRTPQEPRPAALLGRLWSIDVVRRIAVPTTVAIVLACAVLLWLAPWPVDALAAVAAAVAWTSWLDRREQA